VCRVGPDWLRCPRTWLFRMVLDNRDTANRSRCSASLIWTLTRDSWFDSCPVVHRVMVEPPAAQLVQLDTGTVGRHLVRQLATVRRRE
jgi:hypothetical protein